MKLSRTNGQLSPAVNVFRSFPVSAACYLLDRRFLCHHFFWVTGMCLASGDYLFMVSHDESDQVVIDDAKRWEIEVLCQSLKERGFNAEDAHLKDEAYLKLLFAVITITFC